jgi:hypothetical protein
MRQLDLAACRQTPLTADDRFVLQTIYGSRLRAFFAVFAVMTLVLVLKAGPYLLELDSAAMNGLIGWTALILLLIVPALIAYLKSIRPYRCDLRAGFKYTVGETVVAKSYFSNTDQYFLALDDVQHMHHEVSAAVYAEAEVGRTFPVYFAAHSRYPFTLRTRVTMM